MFVTTDVTFRKSYVRRSFLVRRKLQRRWKHRWTPTLTDILIGICYRQMKKIFLLLIILVSSLLALLTPRIARADERLFTYSYEANVLPMGTFEFEQWVTNQNGKEDGDFSQWNFRTEIEYGVTDSYTSSLYLNWDSTRSEGVTDVEEADSAEFKGISWENVYQLLNPNIDPVGLAVYSELTSDGLDYEIETKLLVSKPIGEFSLVANAIYEAEWEREDNQTAEEGTLEFTFGTSYKISPAWAVGIEARNKSAYPDGVNLSGQEFQTWSVGPNIHYGTPKWWATLTILPQIWGNGEGAEGNRQLVHEESLEVRLITGIHL